MTLHKQGYHRLRFSLLLVLLICLLAVCAGTASAQEVRYTVHFDSVRQMVPDTVAWLYQPDLPINTPVLYSKDAKYYLKRDFFHRTNQLGALFFTGEAAPDLSEPVLVLYGANASTDELFGNLYRYRREEGFYQQYPTFYLYTPQGDYRLDVFAGIRTSQDDKTSWKVTGSGEALLDALPGILERSFLTPLPGMLPEAGDQWLLLSAEGRSADSSRYVLYTRCRPMEYSGTETVVDLNALEIENRETLNGTYAVEGVGEWMLYGQNDPLWDHMIFETPGSSKSRNFGDGGCGPTAVALAIANLLEPEELCKISNYATSPFGYAICSCSITQHHCYRYHLPYPIQTPEQMLRFFPLVVGSFATGNNTLDVQGRQDNRFGSRMDYLEALCQQVYGITIETTTKKDVAFSFLQQGKGMVITSTVRHPFTNSSHFLTLAGADDTYLYVLDPLRRETYESMDPWQMLHVLTPGLVRLTLADAHMITLSPFYLLSYPESASQNDPS